MGYQRFDEFANEYDEWFMNNENLFETEHGLGYHLKFACATCLRDHLPPLFLNYHISILFIIHF